jgi:hypothetical protein
MGDGRRLDSASISKLELKKSRSLFRSTDYPIIFSASAKLIFTCSVFDI